jgi:MFS family permease
MGIGTGLSLPLLIALVSDASPEGKRGVGTGLRESVNQASSSLSPVAMGGVVGLMGIGFGFLASAGFCWLLLAAALLLHAKGPRPGRVGSAGPMG